MIYIDLSADLNAEDDDGRNLALLAQAVEPSAVIPGAALIAGTPNFWSWVTIEAIDDGIVYLRRISAKEAARHGPLVAPLRRPA